MGEREREKASTIYLAREAMMTRTMNERASSLARIS